VLNARTLANRHLGARRVEGPSAKADDPDFYCEEEARRTAKAFTHFGLALAYRRSSTAEI